MCLGEMRENRIPEDPARGSDVCGDGGQRQVASMVGGTMCVGKPEDVLLAIMGDERIRELLGGDTGKVIQEVQEAENVLADFLSWLEGVDPNGAADKMFEGHDAVLASMYTTVALRKGNPLTVQLGMEDVRDLMFSAVAYIWWAQNVKGTMSGKL